MRMSIWQAFYGTIDNFQVYHTDLSKDAVIDIYNNGKFLQTLNRTYEFHMKEYKFYDFFPI